MPEALPPRPNLNWLRNRATERLVEMRATDPAATRASALLYVARDYGFPSWQAIKAEVDARSASPEAVLARFKAAVGRGDAAAVTQLLDAEPVARANVNAPLFAFDGRPIAAARHHPAVVDVLLTHGADINLRSGWWAGGFGVLDGADPATAAFLISRGAVVDIWAAAHLDRADRAAELLDVDPTLVNAPGGDGGRPLHFAASVGMVDLLLDRGAEVERPGRGPRRDGRPVARAASGRGSGPRAAAGRAGARPSTCSWPPPWTTPSGWR